MGLGVISSDDFNKTLESLEEKVVRPIATIKDFVGRGNKKEVPVALRKVIAGEALAGAPAAELSKTFGVSESSVSAYKNDATSTSSYNEPDTELQQANKNLRSEITEAARTRLSEAIKNITDEKLADAKLRDIASVAKDMSAVIKNMEPSNPNDGRPVTQFIYYAPKQRTEKEYAVIDVTE